MIRAPLVDAPSLAGLAQDWPFWRPLNLGAACLQRLGRALDDGSESGRSREIFVRRASRLRKRIRLTGTERVLEVRRTYVFLRSLDCTLGDVSPTTCSLLRLGQQIAAGASELPCLLFTGGDHLAVGGAPVAVMPTDFVGNFPDPGWRCLVFGALPYTRGEDKHERGLGFLAHQIAGNCGDGLFDAGL